MQIPSQPQARWAAFQALIHLGHSFIAGILTAATCENAYAQAQRQQQYNNFFHFGFTSLIFGFVFSTVLSLPTFCKICYHATVKSF